MRQRLFNAVGFVSAIMWIGGSLVLAEPMRTPPASSSGTLTAYPATFTFIALRSTLRMRVTARASDGIVRDVTTEPGIAYESSDPRVVRVDAKGLLTATGYGRAIITVTYVSGRATATIAVEKRRW